MRSMSSGLTWQSRFFNFTGPTASGAPVFRKKLSRAQVLKFLVELRPCLVAMEACALSHHWGREITKFGHDVRLIPPIYMKLFVKWQKNDANDVGIVAKAAMHPAMRFVPIKTAE